MSINACDIEIELEDEDYVVPVLQGPRGETGPAGGTRVVRLAETAISGHRVVMARPDRRVGYPDLMNPQHAILIEGISAGAAAADQALEVQVSGEMIESSWNWNLGPVYCGPSGLLTQSLPMAAWLRQVGVAVAPDTILINLMPPIILSLES